MISSKITTELSPPKRMEDLLSRLLKANEYARDISSRGDAIIARVLGTSELEGDDCGTEEPVYAGNIDLINAQITYLMNNLDNISKQVRSLDTL